MEHGSSRPAPLLAAALLTFGATSAWGETSVRYNLTQYGEPLTSRVSTPPDWFPAGSEVDYRGHLDAYWLARLGTDQDAVEISQAQAVALGAPDDFTLITAPDNCWGMFMNFGLIELGEAANLTITVESTDPSSSLVPAFAFYQGWDQSALSSRHLVINFGTDNPLGTEGLTFLGDAYAGNQERSVTHSLANLPTGRYQLFSTSRSNIHGDGPLRISLRTSPPGEPPEPSPPPSLCGLANNAPLLEPPKDPDLCHWGTARSHVESLRDGRYTWLCASPDYEPTYERCYTLANHGRENQPPLIIDSVDQTMTAGEAIEAEIIGGAGKGSLRLSVSQIGERGRVCRVKLKKNRLQVETRRPGTCRMTARKGRSRGFNAVESIPWRITVVEP